MIDSYTIPLVSIIIPTYGRADMLGRAVDSVLNQTYQNIEIIIVNDNTKDSIYYEATIKVIETYKYNKKIKVISIGVNVGGGLARNLGIEKAKGEYVSFLDDDDYYYHDKIKKQLEHIWKNDIDVSVCDMDILKNGKILKENKKGLARVGGINNFIINGSTYTPMIFSKKKVMDEIKGFTNTPRFQDHILMIKILENRFRVEVLRERLYVLNDHLNERISYSEKSVNAYKIRNDFEKRNLHLLNRSEMIKYRFNDRILKVSIFSPTWGRVKSIKYILESLFYVRSLSGVFISFKSFIKILMFKSK